MKKVNVNAVVFAQVSGSTKSVVAIRGEDTVYLAHSLLTVNKPIYEALGGKRVEGVKHFQVDFSTVKNAKAFIAQAITEMSEKDYNKARKTEPKAKVEKKASAPAKTKGSKKATEYMFTTVTDADGNKFTVRTSELQSVKEAKPKTTKGNTKPTTAPNAKAKKGEKVAPKKTKGNAAPLTDAQTKHLNICKMSILNRAASAYSIANGGSAVNFKDLGKSEKELAKFMPKAKADMLKSDKWAKAVKAGVTEDMLG